MIGIICPTKTITGGAELMHQIANELSTLNIPNCILYVGEPEESSIIHFRRFYTFSHRAFSSISESKNEYKSIIVPETFVRLFEHFPKEVNKYILWASINNYFRFKDTNNLSQNILNVLKKFFGYKEKSFLRLKHYTHLHQSHYAKNFLEFFGYNSRFIGDYLNEKFLEKINFDPNTKENIVLFNPKKGLARTKSVISFMPNIRFIPLENLSKDDLISLMKKAKIYIDFGLHPGKDRLPREAALYGCIILTSRNGSAKNEFDIPIDKKFKFKSFNAPEAISSKIYNYLKEYHYYSKEFDSYRQAILNEKRIFSTQIRKIFNSEIQN